jgi:hypothetical protein
MTDTSNFIRRDLIEKLGNEIGKSIYKQFTQNEKYLNHNLSYLELKQLIDMTYSTIYEQLYKDKYGDKQKREVESNE